ncbi:MAG: hypothetical protein EXR72_27155 [Myxococcales bacterium]|nr:hypothetical protein [Myxococcales bacterium]
MTPRTAFPCRLLVAAAMSGCAAATPLRPAPALPAVAGEHDDLDPALLREAGVDAALLRCNRENRWGASLRGDAREGAAELMALVGPSLAPGTDEERAALQKRLQGALMWRMVRAVLIEGDNNNLGAFPLRGRSFVDGAGRTRPVLVFRSGFTPDPDSPGSCFRSLLDAGGVRHVVNLFDGEIPARDLVDGEGRAAARAGATYRTAGDGPEAYGPWRDLLRKSDGDPAKRREATGAVARLIREQILLPGGAPPRGNVHLHCGGGMHRTGMIAGVVERCVNREAPERVEANYRRHVGWRDAAHPGGLEEDNLRFIREFDCALLD